MPINVLISLGWKIQAESSAVNNFYIHRVNSVPQYSKTIAAGGVDHP